MADTDDAEDAAKEGEKGEAGEASSVASANAQPCADEKDEAREDVEASEEVEDTKSSTTRSHGVEGSIQHSPFKQQNKTIVGSVKHILLYVCRQHLMTVVIVS